MTKIKKVDIETGELFEELPHEKQMEIMQKEYDNKRFQQPYGQKNNRPEKTYGVSMTIPDQSMSIKEIIQNFAQGKPLGGKKDSIFIPADEDLLEGRDIRSLDLPEQHAILMQMNKRTRDLRQKVKQEHEQAKWKQTELDLSKQDPEKTAPTDNTNTSVQEPKK